MNGQLTLIRLHREGKNHRVHIAVDGMPLCNRLRVGRYYETAFALKNPCKRCMEQVAPGQNIEGEALLAIGARMIGPDPDVGAFLKRILGETDVILSPALQAILDEQEAEHAG